jgi:hypothetical protein
MANRQLTQQPDDWEDVNDWEDDTRPTLTVPAAPTQQPSMLGGIWDAISQPLTTLPSEFASGLADYIDRPSLERSPLRAQIEGFGAGALQGLGDVISGFTSPIDLATTALTGGGSMAMKAGLPQVAKLASMGGKAAGALTAAHGAGNVFSPDSTMAERGFGLAELAGGVGGMRHTPGASAIGESVKGKKGAITAESFGEGFWKTPEKPLTPEQGKTFKHAMENKPAEMKGTTTPDTSDMIDKFAKMRAVPVGTKYTVSASSMTRRQLTDAIKLGFDYQELVGDGSKIVMKKVRESPQPKMPEPPEVETNALMDAANIPRTIMASMDMSAPLRQGIGLIHRKEFWNALPDMFRAWGSEDAYKAIQKGITDDPIFKKRVTADGNVKPSFAEDVGLKLTDLNNFTNREETMLSTIAEKIPGVRRSNRAYTAFLNKLRADTFKQMTQDYGVTSGTNMRNNVKVGKEIAEFVNNATGRGDLGKLEPSAKALSTVLFSPRLIASRLGMMSKGAQALFSPEVYMISQPSVRREYLKSLAAIAGTAGTFTQLMRLGGATVETDPASSDFGKPKIGNTRIDPYGGFQQYIVLMQRLMPQIDLSSMGLGEIGGKMKSTTTGREYDLANPQFGQSDKADVLNRFIRSKTNPIINFAWGMMSAQKEISGQKMDVTNPNPFENAVAQRFIPMLIQDVYELVNDEVTPPQAKALATFLSTFGMGSQTYGGRQ